jgi:hypothetical protein
VGVDVAGQISMHTPTTIRQSHWPCVPNDAKREIVGVCGHADNAYNTLRAGGTGDLSNRQGFQPQITYLDGMSRTEDGI